MLSTTTWNVLCTFLYTGEQLAANPMQLVGRPKLASAIPIMDWFSIK